MKKIIVGMWFVSLFAAVAASAMWVRYRSKSAAISQATEEARSMATTRLPPKKIQDFALTDSEGADFDSRDLRGQVWVVSFFFASCPSVCRQQNQMVRSLYDEFRKSGVRFVSITCDPENDTPERLRDYGKLYDADPEDWCFLTGPMSDIERIGSSFQLAVATRTHAERFLVIDKWGWLRGMYDWHEPAQLAALKSRLAELLAEESSPHEAAVTEPAGQRSKDLVWDFTLTERSGQPFHSQDMLGRVWVVSFFFSTCPSICRAQNDLVRSLCEEYGQKGVTFVCITCDPQTDTAGQLRQYAKLYDAHPDRWLFLTGDLTYIRRIGAERFQVPVDERSHVDRLIVVDSSGHIAGSFDWHDPLNVKKLKQLLDRLSARK